MSENNEVYEINLQLTPDEFRDLVVALSYQIESRMKQAHSANSGNSYKYHLDCHANLSKIQRALIESGSEQQES